MGKFARIIYALELNNILDDIVFRDIIRYSLHLGITDREIGNEFGVANSTVHRWINGVARPHPAIRQPIFEWLKPRIYARIAQLGERSPD